VVVDKKLGNAGSLVNRAISAQKQKVLVLYTSGQSLEAAKRIGVEALLEAAPLLRGIAWVNEHVRLELSYVSALETVFELQPQVGLVSSWGFLDGAHKYLDAGPASIMLTGTAGSELPQCSAVSVKVLLDAQASRCENPPPSEDEATLWKTLAEGGWSAATFPGFLMSILPPVGRGARTMPYRRRYSVMALIQFDSAHIAMRWFLDAPWREKVRWIGRILSKPQPFAQWINWQLRRNLAALRPR
jgi:hypothetical protein